MRVAALYSGGKDSTYAAYLASREAELVCLVSLRSRNPASFMFHTPATNVLELGAQAMGLPLILKDTAGEKEDELNDLRAALETAKREHGIRGVVTGALASTYQATRIQRICQELGLWCFNPLWQMPQHELLKGILRAKIKAVIVGIAAEPFDASWLGRPLNTPAVAELAQLAQRRGINPAGEGGEYETLVLDSPLHKARIKIIKSAKRCEGFAGELIIKEAALV